MTSIRDRAEALATRIVLTSEEERDLEMTYCDVRCRYIFHDQDLQDRILAALQDEQALARGLTFSAFQKISAERSKDAYGESDDPWSLTDWGCAIAGEAGELCNVLKKRRRGDEIPDSAIKEEIGGTIAYLALLCDSMGFDLDEVVRDEFNRVSHRIGRADFQLREDAKKGNQDAH